MDDISLTALASALLVLLVLSGFFSLSETAMMAANRYRLHALAQTGNRGAEFAADLLARTDRLLGVILLFNNLVNAAAATLASLIAIELFGENKWALGIGTLLITFLILVFSEITPKVIGARSADRLAPLVSYVLWPLLRVFSVVVSFVNLFVSGLLWLLRLKGPGESEGLRISPEELRCLVLESSHFLVQKHRSILLNLFELEDITAEDVMTPRGTIEAIDLQAPLDEIKTQISTSYHTRLPVCDGDLNNVIGILHQRRLLAAVVAGELDKNTLRERLAKPYFIPGTTPIYSQLQFFQENQQRIALVVDEYGEVEGLVTLEDIIEEIVGKFTTSAPGTQELAWDNENAALVDGHRSIRELNRKLGLNLPQEGPKTLNGLILEHFEDIPESGVGIRVAGVPIEVVQTQDRMVRTARLFKPNAQIP